MRGVKAQSLATKPPGDTATTSVCTNFASRGRPEGWGDGKGGEEKKTRGKGGRREDQRGWMGKKEEKER